MFWHLRLFFWLGVCVLHLWATVKEPRSVLLKNFSPSAPAQVSLNMEDKNKQFVFPNQTKHFGKSLKYMPYFTQKEMDEFFVKFKSGSNPAMNKRSERRTVEQFTYNLQLFLTNAFFMWRQVLITVLAISNKQEKEFVFILVYVERLQVLFLLSVLGGLCSHSRSTMISLCHYKLDNLIEVPENVSATSQIQAWHRPRGTTVEPQPVMDVIVKRPRINTNARVDKRRKSSVSCTL